MRAPVGGLASHIREFSTLIQQAIRESRATERLPFPLLHLLADLESHAAGDVGADLLVIIGVSKRDVRRQGHFRARPEPLADRSPFGLTIDIGHLLDCGAREEEAVRAELLAKRQGSGQEMSA